MITTWPYSEFCNLPQDFCTLSFSFLYERCVSCHVTVDLNLSSDRLWPLHKNAQEVTLLCALHSGLHSECITPLTTKQSKSLEAITGGGGGFVLVCEDLGRMFDNLFPAYAFFFFKVEISSRTLIPILRPGSVHSGSASRGDCDWVFPDDLRLSYFPDRFPHSAWTGA